VKEKVVKNGEVKFVDITRKPLDKVDVDSEGRIVADLSHIENEFKCEAVGYYDGDTLLTIEINLIYKH
jgi:hypothetical protein